MSEEEKKALEYIKKLWFNEYDWAVAIDDTTCEANLEKINKAMDTVLNYIDKLQKELKDSINARFELQRRIDKIKEALGDKNIPDEIILTYIETLVSENARLEDIEDRKVQIEYNNVFNKGVKSVEDKIRTKIKELEEETRQLVDKYGNMIENKAIRVLKELLGDN